MLYINYYYQGLGHMGDPWQQRKPDPAAAGKK
jgi:hypothetical protein